MVRNNEHRKNNQSKIRNRELSLADRRNDKLEIQIRVANVRINNLQRVIEEEVNA